ncbi:MAG: HAD-IIIA family hydrolase, partial [Nitrosomonadales bacterium]|nr:HAD-IIIA family hydrolase [Nitrosomonadales bacterium]
MKLVILDRDGVINQDSKHYIKSPDEWVPIEGSLEAISLLNKNGYTVVVATNQGAIGKKLFNTTTLDKIHKKMQDLLKIKKGKIDKIFYCPHIDEDKCL